MRARRSQRSNIPRKVVTALAGMALVVGALAVGGLSTPARGQPARKRGDRVERDRVDRDHDDRRAAAARCRTQLGDGAGRGLRRGQRDRRRQPALPRGAARDLRRFEGGGGGNGRLSRARRLPCASGPVPGAAFDPAAALRRVARERARRGREGTRDRGRRGGSRCDAHRTGERRPLRPVYGRRRHRSWSVAEDAAQPSGATRPLGWQTCVRSSSRTSRCSAPTARTRSRAPPTRRTSTR